MLRTILKEKHMSVLRCSKESNVPYSTLADLVHKKTDIKKTSADTLYKLAKALDVSMETLFEQCAESEAYRTDFEAFKSSVCHAVKEKDDLTFIIETLQSKQIDAYWEREWLPECFYLLAMVDYLSRLHNLPICREYNHIRQHKLQEPLYPRDVRLMAKLDRSLDVRQKCLEDCIPEFLRFNIIESEVRNVC